MLKCHMPTLIEGCQHCHPPSPASLDLMKIFTSMTLPSMQRHSTPSKALISCIDWHGQGGLAHLRGFLGPPLQWLTRPQLARYKSTCLGGLGYHTVAVLAPTGHGPGSLAGRFTLSCCFLSYRPASADAGDLLCLDPVAVWIKGELAILVGRCTWHQLPIAHAFEETEQSTEFIQQSLGEIMWQRAIHGSYSDLQNV